MPHTLNPINWVASLIGTISLPTIVNPQSHHRKINAVLEQEAAGEKVYPPLAAVQPAPLPIFMSKTNRRSRSSITKLLRHAEGADLREDVVLRGAAEATPPFEVRPGGAVARLVEGTRISATHEGVGEIGIRFV